MECSICSNEIELNPMNGWSEGHNAEPVNGGRCCDLCNQSIVIPTRMVNMFSKFDALASDKEGKQNA